MRVSVLGAGAGGAAAAVELAESGHEVLLWSRSADTLMPFESRGGVRFEGIFGEGIARPALITSNLSTATRDADAVVVTLPTQSHAAVALALATADWPSHKPIVLNPGHTGGALEFDTAFRTFRGDVPTVAEFSTLTYVARKYSPDTVTITGHAKKVRVGALPKANAAIETAVKLFPSAEPVSDVLACDLANVNMVLHPPGAVLGAAWVEASAGDFTFYVDAMTNGVARAMHALDDERRAVARAFGHDLPNLVEEMKRIGTVEPDADGADFASAIASGKANAHIKAPDSFAHRYYREDFGHGLLPFLEFAAIAEVDTPIAASLFALAEAMTGNDYRAAGRTASAMGIQGYDMSRLQQRVLGT
jgi:opine dehydrogenase